MIDVVWHFQLQIYVEHSTTSDTVVGLGKVQCAHDNIVVGLKEGGDGVEDATVVDAKRLIGELVQETEVWSRMGKYSR